MGELPEYILEPSEPQDDIKPPVLTRIQELPFDELTWENFERLCRQLIVVDQEIRDCRLYGRRGQNQKGIDLIAYPKRFEDSRPSVYQCKRVKQFGPSMICGAVDKFIKSYKKLNPSHLFLCCRCQLSSVEQDDEILKQARKLQEQFFEWLSY